MAYMPWARWTSAIVATYRGSPEAPTRLEEARAHRRWLESLAIPDDVRAEVVEAARAVEEAFAIAATEASP